MTAFLGGLFGNKTAEEGTEEAVAQVATGEKTRITVTVARPMGMVLEAVDDRKGAFVVELVAGGNADESGMIEVGDVLVACGFDAPDEEKLENKWYESILDTLGERPDKDTIMLTFERAVLEDDEDMLGVTADAKRYWEEKRKAKEKLPKMLRRTPGVEFKDIKVNNKAGPLGSGSFGTVFRGTFKGETEVVLKTANKNTMAAEELLECEMELNEQVHFNAKGTCARYMGCIELSVLDGGELYNGTLTEGLWLMWANEGSSTVEQLMLSGTDKLAAAMQCSDTTELGVTRKAMSELLGNLARLHAVGIVHRDVKPANLIVSEVDGGVLKLIDLGAAAMCLGDTLLNYYPGNGPADPRYCKDGELYLLPEGAPRPSKGNAEKLWRVHGPDRFDCYSAGATMMQLAVPGLRKPEALDAFLKELKDVGYDVKAWRAEKGDGRGYDFTAMDANDGAGWDLAQRLMEPERGSRVSAEAALKHPFFL